MYTTKAQQQEDLNEGGKFPIKETVSGAALVGEYNNVIKYYQLK